MYKLAQKINKKNTKNFIKIFVICANNGFWPKINRKKKKITQLGLKLQANARKNNPVFNFLKFIEAKKNKIANVVKAEIQCPLTIINSIGYEIKIDIKRYMQSSLFFTT